MEQPLPRGVGLTALSVADARARESARLDRLFDDPFAQLFVDAAGAEFAPPSTANAIDIRAARAEYVAIRTRFFDDELRAACAAGCRQVVVLAAGLDTRAFRLEWPVGARLFELDVAEVLAFKERVLVDHCATPTCERRVVVADLREDWPATLRAAGFAPAHPTAWLAEGILMYLAEPERDALLDAIGACSAPASRLALEPPVWQVSAEMSEKIARGVVDRAELARVAAAVMPQVPPPRDPSIADPRAWLVRHGWQAHIYDVAERFHAYGRATPMMFSPAAANMPARRLATATRL